MIDLSNNKGLAKIKKNEAFVQTGTFRIIHNINLGHFDVILAEIEAIAETLGSESKFSGILISKIANFKTTLMNLKPFSRQKRWDALGSMIKYVSGVADAEDLTKIDKNLENLTRENNRQVEINLELETKINQVSQMVREIRDKFINQTQNSLDIINLAMNIDIAKEKLDSINEAVILAKDNIAYKNILSNTELELIREKLRPIEVESLTQTLHYVQATTKYHDNQIIYTLLIPTTEEKFERLHIIPLPTDGMQIKINYKEILLRDNKTYAIIGKCQESQDNTLCPSDSLKEISEENCIPNLARDKQGNCVFEEHRAKLAVEMIQEGSILIKNIQTPTVLANTCGIGNHTVEGTILVNFHNCTVHINGQVFSNFEQKFNDKVVLLPFLATINRKNKEPLVEMDELHDLHIKNRDRLDNIHLMQVSTAAGAGTIATILTIAYIIYKTHSYCKMGRKLVITPDQKEDNEEERDPGAAGAMEMRDRDVHDLRREELREIYKLRK